MSREYCLVLKNGYQRQATWGKWSESCHRLGDGHHRGRNSTASDQPVSTCHLSTTECPVPHITRTATASGSLRPFTGSLLPRPCCAASEPHLHLHHSTTARNTTAPFHTRPPSSGIALRDIYVCANVTQRKILCARRVLFGHNHGAVLRSSKLQRLPTYSRRLPSVPNGPLTTGSLLEASNRDLHVHRVTRHEAGTIEREAAA